MDCLDCKCEIACGFDLRKFGIYSDMMPFQHVHVFTCPVFLYMDTNKSPKKNRWDAGKKHTYISSPMNFKATHSM